MDDGRDVRSTSGDLLTPLTHFWGRTQGPPPERNARVNNHMLLATFGAVWAVLSVGHTLADHVLGQTDHQAANKAAPTRNR